MTQANSAFRPSGVGKVLASVGNEKAGYGSFRWRMNLGCAGKTVRSIENTVQKLMNNNNLHPISQDIGLS